MSETSEPITVVVGNHGYATLVAVSGEIDIATVDTLSAAGREAASAGAPVVLDLERVSFMDSSGMRWLLDVSRVVDEAGLQLVLLRPSTAVTRLLDLVDLRARFAEVEEISPAVLEGLQPPE